MDVAASKDSPIDRKDRPVETSKNESYEDGTELRWLLRHKVELPEVAAGYLDRPELERRCTQWKRRLTVLKAPGGFGKTALLAKCCRQLRQEGVVVAWLTVDEQYGPVELASYLEFAFQQAGVRTFSSADDDISPNSSSAETDDWTEYRVNRLIRVIEQQEGIRCLLALDEVERLRNSDSIQALNAFLHGAPRNLHFAMAFRERPPGLDIANFMLEAQGESVTVEDLRFSKPEIAVFFENRLSRAELSRVSKHSAGWPIALKLYRNTQEADVSTAELVGSNDTVAAWIESRLWRSLSAEDRDFILDISLFDWIDPALIDETTGRLNSRRRINALVSLDGLLQTVGDKSSTMQLHPLIQEYCAGLRYREDPDRFRSIHTEIAKALAGRGQVVQAMRHAAEAGDAHLVANIAEQEGGITLWIRHGLDAIRTVDGWLTTASVSAFPRLALLRCAVQALSGDPEGAGRVYQSAAAATAGFSRNQDGAKDQDLQFDNLLVLGMMICWQCSDLRRYQPLYSTALGLLDELDWDPVKRGMLKYGLCLSLNEMARFDQAEAWTKRARADIGRHTLYLTPHIDFQLGLAAMAQGRTQQAADAYGRALAVSRPGHLGDATTVKVAEILAAELEFERSAAIPQQRPPLVSARLLCECGAWLDVYAANTGVACELALQAGGFASALSVVQNTLEFARETDRPALVRIAAALRISLLVLSDRVDDAESAWQGDNLPADRHAILDLETYRWREVEAVAGARLHLFIARGDFEPAREFATKLSELASERQLIRTLLRTLSLSIRLEHLAEAPESTMQHLLRYLQLYRQTDYVRPLARERNIVLPLLNRIIEDKADDPLTELAVTVRNALTASPTDNLPKSELELSGDEMAVLRLLGTNSDKQIAKAISLSFEAVRYRIRRIFAKLHAKSRHDAVHRARALGILPPETPSDH